VRKICFYLFIFNLFFYLSFLLFFFFFLQETKCFLKKQSNQILFFLKKMSFCVNLTCWNYSHMNLEYCAHCAEIQTFCCSFWSFDLYLDVMTRTLCSSNCNSNDCHIIGSTQSFLELESEWFQLQSFLLHLAEKNDLNFKQMKFYELDDVVYIILKQCILPKLMPSLKLIRKQIVRYHTLWYILTTDVNNEDEPQIHTKHHKNAKEQEDEETDEDDYPKIKKNKIQCKLCQDIIESTHTHDFKFCKCGSCGVDGGHDYLRRVGSSSLFIELTE
jgi:hypothetical protein